MYYTMKEVGAAAHLTYETLKFYCNQGLVPSVKRDKNRHRIFDEHDLAWVKSLTCLKNCGLSIAEMKTYLALCLEGPSSIPRRQSMLEEKRQALLLRRATIDEALDYLDWKQAFYRDVLAGKCPYVSNLLPASGEEAPGVSAEPREERDDWHRDDSHER